MSITLHGITSTIRSERGAVEDDMTVSTAANHFKALLICAGYMPQSVDECFNTEEQWFPDEDVENISEKTI